MPIIHLNSLIFAAKSASQMAASSSDINDNVKIENTPSRHARKRFRLQGEKFCEVCGEKALTHHFGRVACETCKAFFRRNALRQNVRILFVGIDFYAIIKK